MAVFRLARQLGQGVPTVGPYKPGTWAYNDKLTPVRQDVDEARRLLDEAGWKKDKDGLLERDGKPFLFTILVNQGNDSRIKAAIIIQSQLKALGIAVHIRTVEWAAFIKEFVNKGHFDAIILAWTITLDPDIYDVWHSSRAKPGGLNFTGYRNAEVDELSRKVRRRIIVGTVVFAIPCIVMTAGSIGSAQAGVQDGYGVTETTRELAAVLPGFKDYTVAVETSATEGDEEGIVEREIVAHVTTGEALGAHDRRVARKLIDLNVPELDRVEFDVK